MRFVIALAVSLVSMRSVQGFVPLVTSRSRSSSHVCSMVRPSQGSIVAVELDMVPEGEFVPEPLIDTKGELKFILGEGNYVPGLHDLVKDMEVGSSVEGVSLDAGWGSPNPNLIAEIKKAELGDQIDVSQIKEGVKIYLVNGMEALVTAVTDETFTIDANSPLAGTSYKASVKLLGVEETPKMLEYHPEGNDGPYQVATFALGCFWGSELAFMRHPGVVGTKVGYTQGDKDDPTYKEVCSGTTGHTEANFVTFDSRVCSYEELCLLTMDRLGENKYLLNQVGNDRGTQYRHGIYYHDDKQKEVAEKVLAVYKPECKTECLPARKFWPAEDYHQQYLLKGGQSARKGADEVIRCYG